MTTTAHPDGPVNAGDLAALVAADLGLSRADSRRTVAAVLDNIARTVAAGHPVAITNFGSWHPVLAAERTARNPQTGATVTVPSTTRVRFRAAPRFRDAVRAGAPDAAAIHKNPSH